MDGAFAAAQAQFRGNPDRHAPALRLRRREGGRVSRAELSEPFSTPEQQRGAAMLGIAIFLATEVLLFGGLFAAITFTRVAHPAAFVAASKELHVWIGALNTAVLLSSSLSAAVAAAAGKEGRAGPAAGMLALTVLLGLAFLGIKAAEYKLEYDAGMFPVPGGDGALSEPVKRLFMDLYLVATGLHAIHVTIGIVLLAVVAARIWTRNLMLPQRAVLVEVPVLYWHLVDVIWVFLYPALYLAR
ncbi:MAG: cytochrome c oxidase subunit 3 [Methylobacterium mesophilicum]|nr:cytochrome c oxidase subunit 3 [Methylobacterium mesophilicum]